MDSALVQGAASLEQRIFAAVIERAFRDLRAGVDLASVGEFFWGEDSHLALACALLALDPLTVRRAAERLDAEGAARGAREKWQRTPSACSAGHGPESLAMETDSLGRTRRFCVACLEASLRSVKGDADTCEAGHPKTAASWRPIGRARTPRCRLCARERQRERRAARAHERCAQNHRKTPQSWVFDAALGRYRCLICRDRRRATMAVGRTGL